MSIYYSVAVGYGLRVDHDDIEGDAEDLLIPADFEVFYGGDMESLPHALIARPQDVVELFTTMTGDGHFGVYSPGMLALTDEETRERLHELAYELDIFPDVGHFVITNVG